MTATTRRRVARTSHECSWGTCPHTIQPGEVYLLHTAYPGPGDDAGWATAAGHPVRLSECSDCASRFGRADQLVPHRVQRKRTRGWRMPAGAVYVGRPSRWGNPYAVLSTEILVHDDGRDWWCPTENGGAQAAAVEMYRADLLADALPIARIATVGAVQRELAGRDLACWCPLDQPCHADVLLEVANR